MMKLWMMMALLSTNVFANLEEIYITIGSDAVKTTQKSLGVAKALKTKNKISLLKLKKSDVEKLSKEVAYKSDYFSKVEEPSFWVMELKKDTVKCWLAAWADSPSDAWELRNELRTSLFKRLQSEGVKFHQYNIKS